MKTNNQTKFAILLLALVAVIWGTGFIATEYAIQSKMVTSLIMAIRFVIAAIVMGVFSIKEIMNIDKKTLLHGAVAGTLLFLAFYSQTFGQAFTNVSNSAFLTATNVVMVPFIVWTFTKKKPSVKIFLLTLATLLGIGFLTIKPEQGFTFGKGDLFTLICAVMFALHIAYLGTYAKGINARALTFLQLAVSGIWSLCTLVIFDFDKVNFQVIQAGILPVLYLAVFSTCLCYFLQTYAQQYTAPSKTGIVLCTEGLFGSLFSVALGLEPLTANLVIGGLIILTSIVLMEGDFKLKKSQ